MEIFYVMIHDPCIIRLFATMVPTKAHNHINMTSYQRRRLLTYIIKAPLY